MTSYKYLFMKNSDIIFICIITLKYISRLLVEPLIVDLLPTMYNLPLYYNEKFNKLVLSTL